MLATHDTLARPPLAQLVTPHQVPTSRPPRPSPRAALSASDAVRARAATATLALEAYERVMAEQRAVQSSQHSSSAPR